MSSDIDQLKKKILYRSNYRGTKEMDKLLGAFVKNIDTLNYKDLIDLEKLLDIDDNLYNFIIILKQIVFEDNNINSLFKNFDFNK